MKNLASTLDRPAAQLPQIQAPVEERLGAVVEGLRRVAASNLSMIDEVNTYLLSVPGKLFRPTLLLLSSEVAGEATEEATRMAVAVELVHMATLLHDDAVDHSALRRGMPTVNSLWTHQIAIIMGDYLYSRSVTELADLGNLEALRVLAAAANEMSVGEMRQLLSYDDIGYSEAEYFRLVDAKTASLMSAACEMGALAGAGAYRRPLRRFGRCLGTAFQIADDVLDYAGHQDETGKAPGQDLRERKVTLPLVGALRRMSAASVERVRKMFQADEPSEAQVQEVVGLVTENGGLQYALAKAQEYAAGAEAALHGVAPGGALDALKESVAYAVDRSR